MPALRFRHQEITKHLYARDRLQLLRVDKIGIVSDRIGIAEELYQPAVLFNQVVGEHRDTDSPLTRAQNAKHIVDRQPRNARGSAIMPRGQKPVTALLQPGWNHAAERNDPMAVKVFD